MNPDRWKRIDELFRTLLGKPAAEHDAALSISCANDDSLRAEVLSLLAAHRAAESLEPPQSSNTDDSRHAWNEDELIGTSLGRYRLVRVLGRGGMGTVYEASQDSPNRSVALKIIRGNVAVGRRILRLFQREVQALAMLNHPNIAVLHESGVTEDGCHFFAMELVEGIGVAEHVSHNRLTEKNSLEMFVSIIEAIGYAHQRGVIHRDLKPSNIMVDRQGRPKILDFGLAKITDNDIALATISRDAERIQGTLAYMSPEQARGNTAEIDLRSDIYSLGVILYELLTGELPYDVRTAPLPLAMKLICEEPPKSLRRARNSGSTAVAEPATHSRFASDLETIVQKALTKDKIHRYQSASEFAADIRRYLTGQPIIARPPSATYQLKMLIARNKVPAVLAALVFLLLIGFSVSMSVLYRNSQRNLSRAVRAEKNAGAEALTAQKIGGLLTQIFDAADPAVSSGTEPSVRKLVDEGISKLDELMDQPRAQASLMHVLGRVCRNLGQYDKSLKLFQRSLQLQQEHGGEGSREYALTLADAGVLQIKMGDRNTAQETLSKAVAQLRNTIPEDHAQKAAAIGELGTLLAGKRDVRGAEPLLREQLMIVERMEGGQSAAAATAHLNLGLMYYYDLQNKKAEMHCRKSLEIRRKVLPPGHIGIASSLESLALVLSSQGNHQQAITLAREGVEIDRRALGTSPDLGNQIGMLGRMLRDANRIDEAVPVLNEALTMLKGVRRQEYLIALAEINLQRGKPLAAEPYSREALALVNNEWGPRTWQAHRAANILSIVLNETGRPEQAEEITQGWVKYLDSRFGTIHPATGYSLFQLGRSLCIRKCYSEALPHLRRAVQIADGLGLHEDEKFRRPSLLGECLFQVGNFEESETLLTYAYEGLVDTRGASNPSTKACAKRLATLYERWSKPELSKHWRQIAGIR